jgi:hypothetical protein
VLIALVVAMTGNLALNDPSSAQVVAGVPDWASQVFPERTFDLGTVARGSKLRHSFPVVNRTEQDIHIADTIKKCGCTEVRLGARDIPPGTQTYIEVVLDTTRFQGYKASGVTLVLDRPSSVSIDLNLNAFIRDDVTLSPGTIDFGTVTRGDTPTIALTLTYAGGQSGWKVVAMETVGPYVTAELSETARTSGSAQFQLKATLSGDLPVGPFKDEITLRTNDPRAPVIPVSVAALVQGRVTISPSTLVLGRLKPGQAVKTTVLLRASAPCKLVEAQPVKGEASAATTKGNASQAVHPVTVTIKAPPETGPFTIALDLVTDLPNEPPTRLTAFGTVTP